MKKNIIWLLIYGISAAFAVVTNIHEILASGENLSGFKYRKAVYISGGDKELFDYPVKISVGPRDSRLGVRQLDVHCEGIVKPDFADVRFTSKDAQTPLFYYLEGKFPLGVKGYSLQGAVLMFADFWVKVPHIPKEGTMIYIHYGNKEAVSASDPQRVFPFFDDFSFDKLDETRWQIQPESNKGCRIEEGYLRLNDCALISRKFKMQEAILEYKAKTEKNAAIQAIIKNADVNQPETAFEEIFYSSGFPGAEHTIAVNDVVKLNIGNPILPQTDYIYKVIVNAAGITFERYSRDYEKQVDARFLDARGLNESCIGLKSNAAVFEDSSVYFDWVRLRPYTEIEPRVVDGH